MLSIASFGGLDAIERSAAVEEESRLHMGNRLRRFPASVPPVAALFSLIAAASVGIIIRFQGDRTYHASSGTSERIL